MPKKTKAKKRILIDIGKKVGSAIADPVGAYIHSKDAIRTMGQKALSAEAKSVYIAQFKKILKDMNVSKELRTQILDNVKNATTVNEVLRTKDILTVLQKHDLHGDAANQFFLGGHFRIEDDGQLFNELCAINGAESRFSSHFPETRQEEKGISAGRILPEVLFLTTVENGITYSHFQAEASPWRLPPKESRAWSDYMPDLQTLQTVEHIYDSIVYFAAKTYSTFKEETIHNRSNYGWSPYADDNPISSMSSLPPAHVEDVAELSELLDADAEPQQQQQLDSEDKHDNRAANELDNDDENENVIKP